MKKEAGLPIPLTCRPDIRRMEDGTVRCVHSYDSGACELETEFMCPFYLRWERENPEARRVPEDVPYHVIRRVRDRQPPPELEKEVFGCPPEKGRRTTPGRVRKKPPEKGKAPRKRTLPAGKSARNAGK